MVEHERHGVRNAVGSAAEEERVMWQYRVVVFKSFPAPSTIYWRGTTSFEHLVAVCITEEAAEAAARLLGGCVRRW